MVATWALVVWPTQSAARAVAALATTDDAATPAPLEFKLDPNYPNPFNPETAIRFHLPQALTVQLNIYAATGRLVKRLIDGPMPVGTHVARWDGRDELGRHAPSGVYLYELRSDIREAEVVRGRSINLAISTRGLTALRGVELEERVLEVANRTASPKSSNCGVVRRACGQSRGPRRSI